MKLGSRRPAPAPDADLIRTLAGLLAETGLTEIEYSVGDTRIRVAREGAGRASSPSEESLAAERPPTATAAAANGAVKPTANGAAEKHPGMVASPMVGVAYLAPQPGAAPFVRAGDAVSEGQTLLIIEAMKVMNQIRAPRAGRVAQILIGDGEPVEYGAPLMLIE